MFGSLNALYIGLQNIGQHVFVTTYLHSFPRTFAHIWFTYDPTFEVFPLNYDLNLNSSYLFVFCMIIVL